MPATTAVSADRMDFSPELAASWTRDDLEQMEELLQKLFTVSAACCASASKRNVTAYKKAVSQCRARGISAAVDQLKSGLSPEEVLKSFRKGAYYALIRTAFKDDPYFSDFSGTELDLIIEKFRRLDTLMIEASRREICRLAAENRRALRTETKLIAEWNLLNKYAEAEDADPSQVPTIRSMIGQLPDLFFRLYPCILMSPDAAAQYLPFRKDLFDLVIFDEASQIETCKAVSALARGCSAVIAGDSNQLPPTAPLLPASFEKSLKLEDMESILKELQSLSVPCETLIWHYRSSHESLIAFCNKSYYGNRINTFPAADEKNRRVIYRNVGGVFKNSGNRQEALAIVEELKKIASDYAGKKAPGIGIIAFSKVQQDVIRTQIEKACKEDSAFNAFIRGSDHPEIFVKNLENVQGDERDIILFSVAYGPGEDGRAPSYRFGKIDGSDGWKRLNVAFSRAREEMIIFASIHGDDIPITRFSSRGRKEIKAFLNYAEHGLPETEISAGSSMEQPSQERNKYEGLADAICRLLTDHGYAFTRDLGSSGLRIPVAVISPSSPDRFCLGILIDGFTGGKTARDRYATPQQTFTLRGWQLYHIWTPDWWADPEGEGRRLLDTLAALCPAAE